MTERLFNFISSSWKQPVLHKIQNKEITSSTNMNTVLVLTWRNSHRKRELNYSSRNHYQRDDFNYEWLQIFNSSAEFFDDFNSSGCCSHKSQKKKSVLNYLILNSSLLFTSSSLCSVKKVVRRAHLFLCWIPCSLKVSNRKVEKDKVFFYYFIKVYFFGQ